MSDSLDGAEEMAYRALVDAASSLAYTLSELPLPSLTDVGPGLAFDNAKDCLASAIKALRDESDRLFGRAKSRECREQDEPNKQSIIPPLSRGPWVTP